EDGDMVFGELKQLATDGTELEGGITNTASLGIDLIGDDKIKKSLIGLKKDDTLEIDLKKAYDDETIAKLLSISEEEVGELTSKFKFTVMNINRLEEADLEPEFFDKVFGEGAVKNEEEFKVRVKEEVENMFVQNASQKLQN